MSGVKLETTPVDPRFPNTNQAQHCWTRYNEWVLCMKKSKDDEAACAKARQYAVSLCPNDWVSKWDTQREEHNFAGLN